MSEKQITNEMIWEEASAIVGDGVIFECSQLMSDIFIPFACDCDDRRIFDIEDMYKNCCPDCGSCNIEENDEDEDEDEEGGAWICSDCGYKFDDPDLVDPLEFWFVESWLASRLEDEGEMIIRTCCTPDIWARCTSGQQIRCDGVIQSIAKKTLKNRFVEWEGNK